MNLPFRSSRAQSRDAAGSPASQNERSWWRLPLLALVTGFLSAFAFEPVGWWPLMPLAFTALAELIRRAPTLKRALLTGWAFGVGQFVLGLNWIATAFTYQAAMPAWLGWVAVVLLSLYLAVYPALAAGLGWRFGQRSRLALVLALAGGWAVTEYLRALMFTGFAWNPVSVVLTDTGLLDTAALIGTYGLSAMVVLIGGALFLLLHRSVKEAFYLLFGLVALATLYEAPDLRDPTSKAIQIVQPNIGQQNKWTDGYADIAARKLAGLSQPPGRPRLVFWPEAAVTDPLQDNRPGMGEAFARFERRRAAAVLGPQDYLLTGGLAFFSSDGRTVDGATNSVFTLTPRGEIVHRFDKSHLTPYGEYLPMRSFLEPLGLSRLVPGQVDFTPGPGPQTVTLPGRGKVGIQICYEIIFSGQVVDARNRPDFIFNPSNDAWFGRWGPPQHFAQARLRAAEEGLPVVRSTPTGISGLIDAHGRTLASLPRQQPGVINAQLPPATASLTPFARFGNWLPMLLAFGLLITAIVLDARRR